MVKLFSYFYFMIKRILLRILMAFGLFVVILIANYVIFGITASKVTEGVPIENRDPERVALLVIDIQEGTTGSTSITDSYISQAESLIANVNKLVADALRILNVKPDQILSSNRLVKDVTAPSTERRKSA